MKQLLILLLSFLAVSCNTSAEKKSEDKAIQVLSPTEFKAQSDGNLLVDIRTPEEYAQGHIENAININFFDKDFQSQFEQFDKSKPIYIYCRSGNRTSKASQKLIAMGFSNVYDLENGINNWRSNNFKIVRE